MQFKSFMIKKRTKNNSLKQLTYNFAIDIYN